MPVVKKEVKKPVARKAVAKKAVKKPTVKLYSYDAEVKGLMGTDCDHHKSNNYYYSINHQPANAQCTKIIQKIEEGLINNYNFSPDCISDVMVYFNKNMYNNSNGYYKQYCCVAKQAKIIPLMSNLLRTYVPTIGDIKILLQHDSVYPCFKVLVDKNPNFTGFDMASLTEFANVKLKDSFDKYTNNDIIDAFFDNCDISNDALPAAIFMLRDTYTNLKLAEKLKSYKLDLTKHNLSDACQILPYSKPVIEVLISNFDMELNSKCLEAACNHCDFNGIKYILDNTKLEITREHFKKLVTSKVYVSPDTYGPSEKSGYTKDTMELLIAHGYSPDYEDVAFAVKYKQEIPNIDRFKIILDTKLLESCWDVDFYPNYKFGCISDEMIKLQKMLANKQPVSAIRSQLKAHTLVPDRKCMENASNHKTNMATIKELIKYGGIITYKCLQNMSQLLATSSTLDYMLEEYKTQKDIKDKEITDKMEAYEAKIKELEEKLAKPEGLPEVDIKVLPEKVIENTEDVKTPELIEMDDDFSDDELAEIKECSIIKVDDTMINKLPKQKRRKSKVPKLYATYFKKKDNTKMSYLEIKKELLDSVRENKWYNPDNKQLINLPEDLMKHLGIEKKGYIKFDDVEKVVNLFYK